MSVIQTRSGQSAVMSLHQIIVRRRVGTIPAFSPMRETVNTGSSHEACHVFTTDPKTQARSQFGMDPARAIRAT